MRRLTVLASVAFFCVFWGCADAKPEVDLVRNAVTAEIKAGIEKHIEAETTRGGGYFQFSSGGKEYRFKLVRVHTEYLSRLGPERHFACVDLVDESGDVYDTDFFLSGKPDAMLVTETTLHKLNGIPYYTWEQVEKGQWKRVPVKGAAPGLLGVVKGQDEFDFLYRAKLPNIGESARMWIPLPETDAFQSVELTDVQSPKEYRILEESRYGNKALFFELGPEDGGKNVDIRYRVRRAEKSAYADSRPDRKKYLRSDGLVPLSAEFKRIAAETVAGKKGDLVRARALYDYVIDRMRYMKHGTGWGKGDAVYACNIRTGNCTDFHAYFIALARSVGIPARFSIGAAIPSERNDGGIDGYHCWVEFYAEGKWWPVDISEADKYSSLSTYYFGHHPANRFEFSRGRDLVFTPGPDAGPINFLAYPVLEIAGEPVKMSTEFFFERHTPKGAR